METELAIHPFEKAGLGTAPFKYRGISEKVCSGQPNEQGISIGYAGQPAGMCDYCGTGIRYCCHIESADGKKFVVGTDCVMKLERADNELVSLVEREKKAIDRKKRAEAAERRRKPEEERIAAARAMIESKRDKLAAMPHPVIPGKTAADYVDYMDRVASHSGLLRMAALIEKA